MRRATLLGAAVVIALAVMPAAVRAGIANGGIPGPARADPIAGLRWGNYSGALDEVYPTYRSAGGRERTLLGYIATTPRMRWFGDWYHDPRATAAAYVANVTARDPDALVQMAVFRLVPWEDTATRRLPSPGEQASYRAWIDAFATGIGAARVAMVLQPDLPFALRVPRHSALPLRLVAYAAKRFAALPHTTVYIDAGASDWPSVRQAAAMLRTAGVRYVRGFALGATHYATTSDEVRFGAKVAAALADLGIPGRHFVVNTAQNGRGFTYQQYARPASFDNAMVCRSARQRRCVTLGIPPTTDVASGRWGLPAGVRRLAARYEDADLWIGRPWLRDQADQFDLGRSLDLARSWPYAP